MVGMAEKQVLDVSIEEWVRYLDGVPSDVGVRLKLRKKNSHAPGMTWAEALDVALCFGWIDGQTARLDDDYVLTGFSPRRKNSPWSKVNREHVARLSDAGLMRPAGLAEVARAKEDGRWEAAYSQKEMVTPADLQAALDANPAATAFHAGLTRIQRFELYFKLTTIKSQTVRADRVRDVVEKAARGEHHYAQPKRRY
jgi:uncharacterized protein YdeI (YjbR/CyaY-like superfamily)